MDDPDEITQLEFENYYHNMINRINYLEMVIALRDPGCTIDRDRRRYEYDIYQMHIDEYTNHYSEDLYSGVRQQVKLYLFLYLKYGILNLLHYHVLDMLGTTLAYDEPGIDLMYQFIRKLIDEEIDGLYNFYNDPNYAESKKLYINVIRFLESLTEDYIRSRIDLLRDLIPPTNRELEEYRAGENFNPADIDQIQEIANRHDYQSIIKQAYSRLHHRNYFQTSRDLINLCSYTSHNDLLILH